MLAVAIPADDANRYAFGIGGNNRVQAVRLAGAAEILE